MPKEGTALGVHVEHKGCSAEQIPAVLVLGLLALTLLCMITGNQPAGRHWQEGGGGRGRSFQEPFSPCSPTVNLRPPGYGYGSYLPPPPITALPLVAPGGGWE